MREDDGGKEDGVHVEECKDGRRRQVVKRQRGWVRRVRVAQ